MQWMIDNRSFIFIIGILLGVGFYYVKRFLSLPSQIQIQKLKEWLLYAVIIVEKEYSHGTGQLKLRAAYNMFVERFPSLVSVVSFELFSKLVDEALVEMRKILETNKDIEAYVKGDD